MPARRTDIGSGQKFDPVVIDPTFFLAPEAVHVRLEEQGVQWVSAPDALDKTNYDLPVEDPGNPIWPVLLGLGIYATGGVGGYYAGTHYAPKDKKIPYGAAGALLGLTAGGIINFFYRG